MPLTFHTVTIFLLKLTMVNAFRSSKSPWHDVGSPRGVYPKTMGPKDLECIAAAHRCVHLCINKLWIGVKCQNVGNVT